MAGRRDSALAVAKYVFDRLDSMIIADRQSNATEMATVYETQKKDEEIAKQQIELTQQRVMGLIIAIVLLTVFFVIYTLFRRRAARRMAEMKAAKQVIESLKAEIENHRKGAEPNDDLTMMCIRVN